MRLLVSIFSSLILHTITQIAISSHLNLHCAKEETLGVVCQE